MHIHIHIYIYIYIYLQGARCWGKHTLRKKADIMMSDKRFLDNNMLVLAVDIALMKDNFAQAKRYLWVPLSTANR